MKKFREYIKELKTVNETTIQKYIDNQTISDIVKISSKVKQYAPPNNEIYKKIIKSSLNNDGWTSNPNDPEYQIQQDTLIYTFYKCWYELSKIKLDIEQVDDIIIYVEDSTNKMSLLNRKKQETAKELLRKQIFGSKKGYEMLYYLMKWVKQNGMSYPAKFREYLSKHFDKNIIENYIIQSNIFYIVKSAEVDDILNNLESY